MDTELSDGPEDIAKARCRQCGDEIEARHGDEAVGCRCGAIAIDHIGCGRWRRIGKPEDFASPPTVVNAVLEQAALIARGGSAVDNLVLGTVNSPWKTSIDADTLAARLISCGVDKWLPHLATFFGEVRAELILAFAFHHGIPSDALKASYAAVHEATGERNPGLDELFQVDQ